MDRAEPAEVRDEDGGIVDIVFDCEQLSVDDFQHLELPVDMMQTIVDGLRSLNTDEDGLDTSKVREFIKFEFTPFWIQNECAAFIACLFGDEPWTMPSTFVLQLMQDRVD